MKRIAKEITIVLLLAVLGGSFLFAEDMAFEQYPIALGAQVGTLSGMGVSYQYWGPVFGYEIAGGAIYHPLQLAQGVDPLSYNFGMQIQYPIYSDTFSTWLSGRLYLLAGAYHSGHIDALPQNTTPETYKASPFTLSYGIGGGVGVEGVFFDHFAVVTEFVYGLLYSPSSESLSKQFIINMNPQISLRYRFD